ncbi:hypothetical protein V6N12_028930 [Hibiscus sabdariffa]|uniref:Uncharacterized protein n=1 Tax=Hibiscus sabdariffa TaxID=183260 RepID=A0ABR2F799_9ROSI
MNSPYLSSSSSGQFPAAGGRTKMADENDDPVATRIGTKLKAISPISSTSCIFKVPNYLQKMKPENAVMKFKIKFPLKELDATEENQLGLSEILRWVHSISDDAEIVGFQCLLVDLK